jgi:NADPH:quinone reductase-like Zn-dependent oxidoreductase
VLLRVRAAALNRFDSLIREGRQLFTPERLPPTASYSPKDDGDVPVSFFPHAVGVELVGVIEELGDGVSGWAVGDRVLPCIMTPCRYCRFCRRGDESLCAAPRWIGIHSGGALAEWVTYPAESLLRVPDSLNDEEAAAIQCAYATAWHMLVGRADLQAGETVLITSVGSGIGSAAIQVAKHAGAYVIGTSSTDARLDRAQKLGIDVGINYSDEDVSRRVLEITDGAGADVVYEHVGGQRFAEGLLALAPGGRLVTCGATTDEVVNLDLVRLFRGQWTIHGSYAYCANDLRAVLELAGRGLVKAVVSECFPLERVREAFEFFDRGKHFGKVILVP